MNFLGRFSKNPDIKNSMKSRPVGNALFHAEGRTDVRADRRTDMTKLMVAFRIFAKRPKNRCNKHSKNCNFGSSNNILAHTDVRND